MTTTTLTGEPCVECGKPAVRNCAGENTCNCPQDCGADTCGECECCYPVDCQRCRKRAHGHIWEDDYGRLHATCIACQRNTLSAEELRDAAEDEKVSAWIEGDR